MPVIIYGRALSVNDSVDIESTFDNLFMLRLCYPDMLFIK